MSLLSIHNLTCIQGVKTLFENITFGIEPGDKIALIGVNGCGKSTLLSLMASSMESPHPSIVMKQGLKVTFLPQIPVFNPEDTILDHLFRSETPTAKVIRDYQLCLAKMEEGTTSALEKELSHVMEQMDLLGAWSYEAQVTSILNELHIHHLTQKMSTLSGGMIKKISLAQVFFEQTDLLIMDEPTNHLDIETIDWLESMLKSMSCALLMVTHDRYFLNKICTKIFEIDQQSLFVYKGNYQTFLEQRDLRYSVQKKEEETIRSVLRVELEWLSRGPKARSTKQKARKDRIDEMVSRNTFSEDKVLELGVSGRRLGKKILVLKHVAKKFGKKTVIRDFSYTFRGGEKIGILGPNGAGKTTLLNIITDRLPADSGEVDVGVNTVFGYFDQHSLEFDLEMSIFAHVKQYGEFITLHDGTQLSASKLLERFLFPSQMLKTPIGKLSGGERRRLHLVCLLLTNPNFLLFDEPTNDLDVITLSVLEDFLQNFAGCVIIISHDRYFMDRAVDQLLIFKGDGTISHFWGGYTDYVDTMKDLAKAAKLKSSQAPPPSSPLTSSLPPEKKRQLTNKEQQEFKKLDGEIEKLEVEKRSLNALFTSGEGTPEEYEKAGKRLKDVEAVLREKLARWEELAEFA